MPRKGTFMTDESRILVVDDDPIVADSLAEFLDREGYLSSTACDGHEAMTLLDGMTQRVSDDLDTAAASDTGALTAVADHRAFGLVITDLNMPRGNGIELLKQIRRKYPSVAVIIITGFGKIETAVEAVRAGAVDYLTKPIIDDELRVAVDKALQQHALLVENQSLRSQLTQRFGLDNIVGADHRMQKVFDLVEAVAPSKTTVLIGGQSGTGKTMVARAVHERSPRGSAPFVTFSCGSIPETLLESELFGHVRGAFTGADSDKKGRILAADGGTLFIDEINSATPALQLKLLRVLQEKQFEPVGSTKTVQVDVRFVLASNEPLQQLVADGRFREDLYYRINVVNIELPLLSERVGDIPLLAEHFLDQHSREVGKTMTHFADEAIDALMRYSWPGNVRELENAVERAVVLSRRPVVEVEDLPDTVRSTAQTGGAADGSGQSTSDGGARAWIPALADGWTPMPLANALQDPEKQILVAALNANNWNRQETARQLDINRTTLYKKIKQYKLDEPQ